MTPIDRSFGTPIVLGDRVVFNAPAQRGDRITCIRRSDGAILWKIAAATNRLEALFAQDHQVVVKIGPGVHGCDPATGRLTLLHQTRFEDSFIEKLDHRRVLIQGERAGVDYLTGVDTSTWRQIWEAPRICRVLARGKDTLLCEEGTRKQMGNGYSIVDQNVLGISPDDGRVLWRYSPWPDMLLIGATAVDEYFVVNTGLSYLCLGQADAKIMGDYRQSDTYEHYGMTESEGRLLVEAIKRPSTSLRMPPPFVYLEFALPGFQMKEIAGRQLKSAVVCRHGDILIGWTFGRVEAYHARTGRRLWRGGPGGWDGIHDGFIYYSDVDPTERYVSINRLNVQTGKRKQLYREELPDELRWKK